MDKVHPWFEKGVDALQAIAPKLPFGYICPLCLSISGENHLFQPEAWHRRLLTREHAPTEKFGGKRVVLTCRECNNYGGKTVDAEFGKFLKQKAFFDKQEGYFQIAQVSLGDSPVRALIGWENGRILLTEWAGRNNPKESDGLQSELKRLADERIQDWSFQVSFLENAYRLGGPEVSLLRSAYLIAFAALGYRYAFRQALEPIRNQIRNPYEEVVGPFFFLDRECDDYGVRRLIIVRRPKWSQSVLVQMGPFRIYLPLWDDTANLYRELASAQAEEHQDVMGSGRVLKWPTEPEFVYDFEPKLLSETVRWLRN